MGVEFPAGHGKDEGERLLSMLASSPATMHHVSSKLCARFVSDAPPDGCIDAAVAAWKRHGGNIREVMNPGENAATRVNRSPLVSPSESA